MPKVTDKFSPTYDLEKFKASHFDMTQTAYENATDLGFTRTGVRQVISTMQPEHFYKSMTSYANHKIWQDVYHVPYGDMILYINLLKM